MDNVRFRGDCEVSRESRCRPDDFAARAAARGSVRLLEVMIVGAALMDNLRGLVVVLSVSFRLSAFPGFDIASVGGLADLLPNSS